MKINFQIAEKVRSARTPWVLQTHASTKLASSPMLLEGWESNSHVTNYPFNGVSDRGNTFQYISRSWRNQTSIFGFGVRHNNHYTNDLFESHVGFAPTNTGFADLPNSLLWQWDMYLGVIWESNPWQQNHNLLC